MEKSNAINCLNLNHGKPWIALIVNIGSNWEGNGIVIGIAKEVLFHPEIGSGFVVLFMIQLIQCYYYANLPVGIRNGLHVTGADPENV